MATELKGKLTLDYTGFLSAIQQALQQGARAVSAFAQSQGKAKVAVSADTTGAEAGIRGVRDSLGRLRDENGRFIKIEVDTAGARKEVDSLSSSIDGVGKRASGLGSIFSAGGLGVAGAAVGIGFLGKEMIQSNAQMESFTAKFEVLTGSLENANKLIGDLKKFGAETPFEFPELAQAATNLKAFGFETSEIVPELRKVGDIASGVGAPIGELAELYGKARVQGTLYAEDINQLVGRGIPVIQEFAKQLGVSESEVKKLASEGKISFTNLQTAFTNLTAEGGKFGGMMDKMSGTFEGLVSTFKDTLGEIIRTLGGPLFVVVKDLLKTIMDVIGGAEVQAALKSLGDLISAVIGPLGKAVGSLIGPLLGLLGPVLDTIISILQPIGDLLAPIVLIISGLVKELTGPLTTALSIISEVFKGIFTPLAAGMKSTLATIVKVITPVIHFVDKLYVAIQPLLVLLGNLIGSLLGPIATILSSILEAVMPILDALLPPLVTIIAAVANLATVLLSALMPILLPLIDLIALLVGWLAGRLGDAIGFIVGITADLIALLVDGLADGLSAVITWIKEAVTWVVDRLGPGFEILSIVIENVWRKLTEFLAPAFEVVGAAIEVLIGFFSDLWNTMTGIVSDAIDGLVTGLTLIWSVIQTVIDFIGGLIKSVLDFITPGDSFESAVGGVGTALDAVIGPIKAAIEWFGNLFGDIVDGINDFLGLGDAVDKVAVKVVAGRKKVTTPSGGPVNPFVFGSIDPLVLAKEAEAEKKTEEKEKEKEKKKEEEKKKRRTRQAKQEKDFTEQLAGLVAERTKRIEDLETKGIEDAEARERKALENKLAEQRARANEQYDKIISDAREAAKEKIPLALTVESESGVALKLTALDAIIARIEAERVEREKILRLEEERARKELEDKIVAERTKREIDLLRAHQAAISSETSAALVERLRIEQEIREKELALIDDAAKRELAIEKNLLDEQASLREIERKREDESIAGIADTRKRALAQAILDLRRAADAELAAIDQTEQALNERLPNTYDPFQYAAIVDQLLAISERRADVEISLDRKVRDARLKHLQETSGAYGAFAEFVKGVAASLSALAGTSTEKERRDKLHSLREQERDLNESLARGDIALRQANEQRARIEHERRAGDIADAITWESTLRLVNEAAIAGFDRASEKLTEMLSDSVGDLIDGTEALGVVLETAAGAMISVAAQAAVSGENILKASAKSTLEILLKVLEAQSHAIVALILGKSLVDSGPFGFLVAAGLETAFLAAIAIARSAIRSAEFYEGGYTGPGPRHRPAGVVHAGEFVFTAEQTAKWRAMFEYMHRGGNPHDYVIAQLAREPNEFWSVSPEGRLVMQSSGAGPLAQSLRTGLSSLRVELVALREHTRKIARTNEAMDERDRRRRPERPRKVII